MPDTTDDDVANARRGQGFVVFVLCLAIVQRKRATRGSEPRAWAMATESRALRTHSHPCHEPLDAVEASPHLADTKQVHVDTDSRSWPNPTKFWPRPTEDRRRPPKLGRNQLTFAQPLREKLDEPTALLIGTKTWLTTTENWSIPPKC